MQNQTSKLLNSAESQESRFSSTDGALTFSLAMTMAGVCVERVHKTNVESTVQQIAIFRTEAEFCDWLDADQLKFAHPHLFLLIKKTAHAFFDHTSSDAGTNNLGTKLFRTSKFRRREVARGAK